MNSLWDFNQKNLLNWIIAFCIFEIPLALFYWNISSKGDMVRSWYRGKDINIWNVIVQDSTYVLCAIIIVTTLLEKLKIDKNFTNFLLLFILVQWIGDSLFALIISKIPVKYSSKWVNFFKRYIEKSGINALIGDTLYIIVWTITYYFVSKYIKSFSLQMFIIFFFLFLVSAYSVK